MCSLPWNDAALPKAGKVAAVIDHLVDALGGEAGCTMRRAVILADIDENPGTTQTDITARLGVNKSTLNRDIEWLYDYGCIKRQPGEDDARAVRLFTCGYSRKNLDFVMKYFDFSHKNLKNFLIRFINLFGQHKPTLRDAKIVATLGGVRDATRQQVMDALYAGPATTESRTLANLIELGIVEKRE